MNDPFAMLNPIEKPKTAPVYGGPPAAPVAPLHPVGGYGDVAPGMGMRMGMGAPGMGMGMGMGAAGMGMGGPGMGMGPGFGGMAPGMGGGMAPGMGQPQAPVQAPVMYDNIKNLLQQKPKPAGSMHDDTSMDFLENLGSAKANSVSVTSPTAAATSPFASAPTTGRAAMDPFGGPAPAVSVAAPPISLSGFEFPGESSSSSSGSFGSPSASPSNAGGKSGALAERLANGRRKTQEAQRQQLAFNAGAFGSTSGAPRISLKDMAPQASSKSPSHQERESRAPSLEDFASGKPVFSDSDPFGGSSATTGTSNHTNSRTSSHNKPAPTYTAAPSAFDDDGGVILADSDADFESKLNGGSGSSRHLSGNLGGTRTGSGSATAATMDFGW